MDNNLSKTTNSIFSLFKENNGKKIIMIAGFIGIALILISSFLPEKKTNDEYLNKKAETETADYTKELEQKLTDIICSINGVGLSKVMVTLESGVEYVYANEEKKNTDKYEDITNDETIKYQQKDDIEQRVIIVDGPDGKEALLTTKIEPKIKGVIVVCEGGENPEVEEKVINAITVALDISSRKVCVSKLS